MSAAAAAATCAHCGEACRREERLVHEGAVFCCAGCRTVYSLLQAHGLTDFYALDERAGRSQRGADKHDYDWLEVEELARRLLGYHDAQRWVVRLELPAIHCMSCVWLLERLPQLLPGVRSCTLDVTRKQATIDFDPRQLSLAEVARTLARFGYPPRIHGAGGEPAAAAVADHELLYRIGVAGFCFGNTMLLSFPEYLGLGADAGEHLFGKGIALLLLGLSLPVLLYAGAGFFRDAWRGLRAGRVTIDVPIALGMAALTLRSYYELATATGPGYLDSLAGLVFFLLLGRWFQGYTFARLRFDRDYHDYFPLGAYRLREDDSLEAVASQSLVAGDRILVKPGQLIPTDGELLSEAREIDYSFVTGEAEPQRVAPGAAVFAGGRATDRALRITVTQPADQSYLLQLWRGPSGEATAEVQPAQRLVRGFTLVILLLAVGTFGYWYRIDPATAYRAATAVLIIACPCALALAMPFAYGTLQRLLGRAGWYLRSAGVLQRLGEVATFAFDKTGTLIGQESGGGRLITTQADADALGVLLGMAGQSTHPRSLALRDELAAVGVRPATVAEVIETPGGGIAADYRGQRYRIGQRAYCGLGPVDGATYAVAGDREIALLRPPSRPVLREGMAEALRSLTDRGRAVYLLSGDHPPALPFWDEYLPAERCHFDLSPFAKQAFVKERQTGGERLLMVGDGLNDAGALRAAHIGLAVAESDNSFSPACDGIVAARQLAALPRVLGAARRVRGVTRLCYAFALLYNLIGLWYAVTGTLSPVVAAVLMPLSSLTIVGLATAGAWWVFRGVQGGDQHHLGG